MITSGIRKIYRPEIQVEYESLAQIPLIVLAICKVGIKKVNVDITCGETVIGNLKVLVIPKYQIKRVKVNDERH